MKNIQYVARENSRFSQKDVDIIAPYIREKLFPDGLYDEAVALADARRPDSPLHKYIDWNDTTAAHKYRLRQIKDLFVCFRIIPIDGESTLPGALSVVIHGGRQYVSTDVAMKSPDLCAQAIQRAIEGLQYWQKRYSTFLQYPEFQEVNDAITKLALTTSKRGESCG